jgi:hypothetical protein
MTTRSSVLAPSDVTVREVGSNPLVARVWFGQRSLEIAGCDQNLVPGNESTMMRC